MKEVEVVSRLNRFLKKNQILFENEIRMGFGIPDVMFGFDLPTDHISIQDYFVLKLFVKLKLYDGESIEDFYDNHYLNKREIKKYLKVLKDLNIVRIEKSKVIICKNININDLGVTVAVEAKVKDWKSGLWQARRYLYFSDYSYLALPKEFLHRVDLNEVSKFGIGLLSIEENEVFEIIAPQKSDKCNEFSKYVSISSIYDKSKNADSKFFASSLKISMQKKLDKLFMKY